MKEELLTMEFAGNTITAYLKALVSAAGGALILIIIGVFIGRAIRKSVLAREAASENAGNVDTSSTINASSDTKNRESRSIAFLRIVQKVVLPFFFLGVLAISLSFLTFEDRIRSVISGIFTAIITFVIIRSVNRMIELSLNRYFSQEKSLIPGQEKLNEKSIRPIISLIKFILWIVGAIFLLANLGFDVTAAVAGLGVSGIAVAVAAQGILGDLFNYFVILLDKPFELGDVIIFDDKIGIIEKIGVKSTKIRTLLGDLLLVSNSDLTSSRIHNMKKMKRRREVMSVGVTYQTSAETVREIPGLLKEIIESGTIIPGVVCDRSHFKEMGAYSLNFEAVYYIPVPDYPIYMDVKQDILQRVYSEFNSRGIEFAYPTQTMFIASEEEDQEK